MNNNLNNNGHHGPGGGANNARQPNQNNNSNNADGAAQIAHQLQNFLAQQQGQFPFPILAPPQQPPIQHPIGSTGPNAQVDANALSAFLMGSSGGGGGNSNNQIPNIVVPAAAARSTVVVPQHQIAQHQHQISQHQQLLQQQQQLLHQQQPLVVSSATASSSVGGAPWGGIGQSQGGVAAGASSTSTTVAASNSAAGGGPGGGGGVLDPRQQIEIYENAGKTISQGATVIPCRARGISKDHNEKVSKPNP